MKPIHQRKFGKPLWDKVAWPDALDLMKTIHKKVKNSDVYDDAVDFNKACFDGTPPIDSCDEKYKPR